MSGDENAKTILGIGGAEELAKAQRALRDRSAEAAEVTPDEASPSPGKSPSFSLDDSSFTLDSDASPGFDSGKGPSFTLQSAEESINRRLAGDSVLGASSLDSLDWDLGDDYDAPSGFDQVMARRTPLTTDILPESEAGDSLPSTSALFGSNYRGAKSKAAEPDKNASTQLFAGDATALEALGLPEVEPIEASPRATETAEDDALEVEFDDVVADDGGTEITEDVPIVSREPTPAEPPVATASERPLNVWEVASLEADVHRPAGDDAVAAPSVRDDGHPATTSDPVAPAADASDALAEIPTFSPTDESASEEASEDPFEFIETAAPLAEPEISGESRKVASFSASGEQVVVVQARPRMQETPRMTVRYDAKTPIITAPVAAARKPTPPSQKVSTAPRKPPAVEENSGTLRYVLAAVVIIGLIAGLLLALR